MASKAFLEIDNLQKIYTIAEQRIVALDNISLTVEKGEFIIILGQSGAGKTTLLNMIGGMDVPSSGDIILDGENVSTLTKKQLTIHRRKNIGFVFQFYNLMPNLTALENVELATELNKESLKPTEVLKSVGLEGRFNNFPAQLSGGEQQRVSIARAIAKNPKLLLCDEPTGALDYKTGIEILKLLHNFCKKNKKTVIIVTHNSEIKNIADKVINIKNGKVESIVPNPAPLKIDDIKY